MVTSTLNYHYFCLQSLTSLSLFTMVLRASPLHQMMIYSSCKSGQLHRPEEKAKTMVCRCILRGLPHSFLTPHLPFLPTCNSFARTSAYHFLSVVYTHLWNHIPDSIICALSSFRLSASLIVLITVQNFCCMLVTLDYTF